MNQENNTENKAGVTQNQKFRIQPEEVCVPKCEPFKYDQIGREQTAKVLTRFIENIDGPGVLAIDASWGAGKTTFLRMWAQYLRNENFPVVSFNAWETDFSKDPFIPLSTELTDGFLNYIKSLKAELENLDSNDEEQKKKIDDLKKKIEKLEPKTGKLKERAVEVFKRAVPGLIRVASAGVVDINPLIQEEIGNILSSYAEDRLNNYTEEKQSLSNFKDELQDITNLLSDTADGHPLVVIIDELDRCRPTYAIELLETAKHLFNVDNIVFVLGINIGEMSHSIRALYGMRI